MGKGEKGGGESEFPMASVTSFHKLKGLIQHTFILPQLSSAARSGESVSRSKWKCPQAMLWRPREKPPLPLTASRAHGFQDSISRIPWPAAVLLIRQHLISVAYGISSSSEHGIGPLHWAHAHNQDNLPVQIPTSSHLQSLVQIRDHSQEPGIRTTTPQGPLFSDRACECV